MSILSQMKSADALFRSPRGNRIVKHPLKVLYPPILARLGQSKFVTGETCFGRKMKLVLPDRVSMTIWRYGAFESDVGFYLLSSLKPGDTFIDIGGHFGYFSMLGRELVGAQGTVVTFEPMPGTRAILEENIFKNAGPANHHLIPAAAGDALGTLIFKDFGLTGSAFATSKVQRDSVINHIGDVEVQVETLDHVASTLDLQSCSLIKIDAENAELEVVRGGLDMINRLRPNIIVETGDSVESGTASRNVVDLIEQQGYRPLEFANWALRPHAVQDSYRYQNLLFVPQEKVEDVLAYSAALR